MLFAGFDRLLSEERGAKEQEITQSKCSKFHFRFLCDLGGLKKSRSYHKCNDMGLVLIIGKENAPLDPFYRCFTFL